MNTVILACTKPANTVATFDATLYGTPFQWINQDNYNASTGTATDLSLTSRNMTQATSGNRPTITTNAIGGHSAITFNGTSQYLTGSDSGFPASNSDRTFFFIFKLFSISGLQVIWSYGNSSHVALYEFNANMGYSLAGGDINTSASGHFGWIVLTIQQSGGNTQLWINNTSFATSTSTIGTTLNGVNELGRFEVGSTDYYSGMVAEYALYASALSSTNRSNAAIALGAKYGIF